MITRSNQATTENAGTEYVSSVNSGPYRPTKPRTLLTPPVRLAHHSPLGFPLRPPNCLPQLVPRTAPPVDRPASRTPPCWVVPKYCRDQSAAKTLLLSCTESGGR